MNKLKSNTYRERDILTHAERNPLRIIHQEFIKFPTKIQNLRLDKAISHTGEDDNEIADYRAHVVPSSQPANMLEKSIQFC